MENPIKMDDLGVPLFLEIPIYNDNDIQLFDPFFSEASDTGRVQKHKKMLGGTHVDAKRA